MKSIYTLVPDIYDYVSKNGIPDVEHIRPRHEETAPTLRLSQMGPRCPKALWYSIHHPELGEPVQPYAQIKFAYGHFVETLALILARASGHTVVGEQDVLEVNGIKGHRDCVIDGCVVDIKSTTTMGFQKFKDKSISQNDPFGYLDQIDGYLVGSSEDPLVTVKDRGYLLAIDKQLGHMCLYEHHLREASIIERIRQYKEIVGLDNPPSCTCGVVHDGKSGNKRLDTRASYSPFKYACFPSLRTFLYSDGPRYLVKVVRLPDVPEVTRDGQIIRNMLS